MSQKDSESYSASKGAIIALTHSMAISLSHYSSYTPASDK